MDFTEVLTENFTLVVTIACLTIGYIIKHTTFFKKIPNDNIPCILAVIGAVLNVVSNGLSLESIVYGALMGVASTGLHQAYSNFVEGKTEVD